MANAGSSSKSALAGIRLTIGQRLRSVRERLGESQAKFAERLGVAKLSVLTYEVGSSCPGADQLCLLSSTGVDASFVAFGVPSLSTQEARRQFASALAWVRHECVVSSLQVSEAGLVEAAWLVFSELSKQSATPVIGEDELRQRAQEVIERIRTSADVVR